jgi:hypothetical protein
VALNPFVYFYARLAHVLTPGILYAPMPTKGFGFQFVTIDRDLSPLRQKGPALIFKRDQMLRKGTNTRGWMRTIRETRTEGETEPPTEAAYFSSPSDSFG